MKITVKDEYKQGNLVRALQRRAEVTRLPCAYPGALPGAGPGLRLQLSFQLRGGM